MRVLSISTLFPNPVKPSFGIFVGNQMRAVVARRDVDLTMISPIGIPPWPLSLREPYASLAQIPLQSDTVGLPVHYPRFTLIPKFGGDSNPSRIVKSVLPLVRKLHAAEPFDLVDASFFFPDGPAAAQIADELGLPLTIKSRGADIHHWGSRPKALSQMLKAADRASGLLAVSQALKRDMIAFGMPEERIFIHYTGLDRDRFKVSDRQAARKSVANDPALAIPADSPLIVTPGALIPRKGQRFAIEALAQLPGVRLAIAGVGEDEVALRALISKLGMGERVHLLGLVTHDRLPVLLSSADAVVLPSASEGLANVWVEALACGAPLVIPDIGGARELVKHASAGRIVARESGAIAEAVKNLLSAPPDQSDVASNADQFSWEKNAARIVEFWQNLARR